MRVTQKDIAQRVGLSRSVVGAVLENRSTNWASEATRNRILEAAREMNYRPHTAARSLRSGKTNTAILVWRHEEISRYQAAASMGTLALQNGALGSSSYDAKAGLYHRTKRALLDYATLPLVPLAMYAYYGIRTIRWPRSKASYYRAWVCRL